MEKIIGIIQNKPPLYALAGLIYILVSGLIKWQFNPPPDALLFVMGGVLGVYFLDVAEVFFRLSPSPFRTIIFVASFAIVSFFVVTSSVSVLARGLVLTLHLMIMLLQISEWRAVGNLNSWYRDIAAPVSPGIQKNILIFFGILFTVETYLFLR